MQITQLTISNFDPASAALPAFPAASGLASARLVPGVAPTLSGLGVAPAPVDLRQSLLMSMLALLSSLLLPASGGQQCPCHQAGGGSFAPVDGASSSGSAGGASATGDSSSGGSGGAGAASSGGKVDPSTVKDKTGTGGLSSAAKAGLDQAHRFGLPLVSGKRSGGGTSDHDHGNAIDVGTLPIGAASSNGGTADMKAFAEFMRQEGKAGRSNVKYIIRDGQIASAKQNWEWRPYLYPGKSQAELDALKRSNPGEYNRLQHFDHVHVSFN